MCAVRFCFASCLLTSFFSFPAAFRSYLIVNILIPCTLLTSCDSTPRQARQRNTTKLATICTVRKLNLNTLLPIWANKLSTSTTNSRREPRSSTGKQHNNRFAVPPAPFLLLCWGWGGWVGTQRHETECELYSVYNRWRKSWVVRLIAKRVHKGY